MPLKFSAPFSDKIVHVQRFVPTMKVILYEETPVDFHTLQYSMLLSELHDSHSTANGDISRNIFAEQSFSPNDTYFSYDGASPLHPGQLM